MSTFMRFDNDYTKLSPGIYFLNVGEHYLLVGFENVEDEMVFVSSPLILTRDEYQTLISYSRNNKGRFSDWRPTKKFVLDFPDFSKTPTKEKEDRDSLISDVATNPILITNKGESVEIYNHRGADGQQLGIKLRIIYRGTDAFSKYIMRDCVSEIPVVKLPTGRVKFELGWQDLKDYMRGNTN